MSMRQSAHVVGIGARTSVGLTALTSAAAAVAKINRFTETRRIDHMGRPIVLASVPGLDDALGASGRIVSLLGMTVELALSSLSVPWAEARVNRRARVLLALPGARPGLDSSLGDLGRGRIEQVLNLVSADEIVVVSGGHAVGLAGIERGVDGILNDEFDIAVVVAGDSYVDPDTLQWLDESGRLQSEENPGGFVPSEAGSCCIIASGRTVARHQLISLIGVAAVATALDDDAMPDDPSVIGTGLTRAIASATRDTRASWVVCDLNGRDARAKEWAYAYLRTASAHGEPLRLCAPADCWGDVGAATGPLLMSYAVQAEKRMMRGRGGHPLVWCSSERGTKAAVLLRARVSEGE